MSCRMYFNIIYSHSVLCKQRSIRRTIYEKNLGALADEIHLKIAEKGLFFV